MQKISRRQFVKVGLCAVACATVPVLAHASSPVKTLSFYNIHTDESISLDYYENGKYMASSLQAFNHFLRDYRTGDIHEIDPRLFDQLHALQKLVEKPGAYHVISGYRSPKTNQMLHANSEGVASHSLHLEGRAIDIRLPGKDLSLLHKAALSMHAGGVGYYPASEFVHIDTGRVRHWG